MMPIPWTANMPSSCSVDQPTPAHSRLRRSARRGRAAASMPICWTAWTLRPLAMPPRLTKPQSSIDWVVPAMRQVYRLPPSCPESRALSGKSTMPIARALPCCPMMPIPVSRMFNVAIPSVPQDSRRRRRFHLPHIPHSAATQTAQRMSVVCHVNLSDQ